MFEQSKNSGIFNFGLTAVVVVDGKLEVFVGAEIWGLILCSCTLDNNE